MLCHYTLAATKGLSSIDDHEKATKSFFMILTFGMIFILILEQNATYFLSDHFMAVCGKTSKIANKSGDKNNSGSIRLNNVGLKTKCQKQINLERQALEAPSHSSQCANTNVHQWSTIKNTNVKINDISQGDNSNQPFLTGTNIEQINDYQSDCKYSMQECQVSRITAKNGLLG